MKFALFRLNIKGTPKPFCLCADLTIIARHNTAQSAFDDFALNHPGETLEVEIDYRKPRGYFATE